MPRKCCVPGCTSNYNNADEYTPVFQFPKDLEKRKQWIVAIKRKDFVPSASSAVCMHHFEDQFLIREDKFPQEDGTILCYPRKKYMLTENAYPTVFQNYPHYLSKSLSKEREPPSERRKAAAQRDEDNFQRWNKEDEIDNEDPIISPEVPKELPPEQQLQAHFEEDQFEQKRAKKLKGAAIPTSFDDVPNPPPVIDPVRIKEIWLPKPGSLLQLQAQIIDKLQVDLDKNRRVENYCCADNCSVTSGEGYTLHEFPDDKWLQESWIIAVNRKDFFPTKYSRLCSKHFNSDCYEEDSNGFRVLKKDAVPVIFDSSRKENRSQNAIETLYVRNIRCYVPGCESEGSNRFEMGFNFDGGKNNTLMFQAPMNQTQFERWKAVIPRSEKDFTRCDFVCELHFEEDAIERFFTMTPENGQGVITMAKFQPTLKKGAIPTKLLETSKSLSVSPNPANLHCPKCKKIRLSSSLLVSKTTNKSENDKDFLQEINVSTPNKSVVIPSPENCGPQIIDCCSLSLESSETSNDSKSDVILEKEKTVSSVHKSFTYQFLLRNLHLIKKPNKWWNIASLSNFIICARWNEKYMADKRVVIEKNLTVRVFVRKWEVNITDVMDILSVDDISALLEKIESYQINCTSS